MAPDTAADLLLAESLVALSLDAPAAAAPRLAAPAPAPAPAPADLALPPRARTACLFQKACTQHRYIRTSDASTIVERPERIRAVKVGVAAAWARLEQEQEQDQEQRSRSPAQATQSADALDELLQGLNLGATAGLDRRRPVSSRNDFKGKGRPRQVLGGAFDILDSDAQLSVDHAALRYIHPKPNRPPGVDKDNDDDRGWESAESSSSSSSSSSSTTPITTQDARAAGPASQETKPDSPHCKPPPWPEQLQALCRASGRTLDSSSSTTTTTAAAAAAVAKNTPASSPTKLGPRSSEIPAHLPQGDLYLCPGSEPAIFGALGACCEAVDRIVAGTNPPVAPIAGNVSGVRDYKDQEETTYDRAFVAIRPPGHHCGEANPQGFCFVNNVAVAAAHAHLEHGIDRVIIFDVDLHHGNGTQEIAWRINADAHEILETRDRQRAAAAQKTPRSSPRKRGSPRKGAGGGGPAVVKQEEEEGEDPFDKPQPQHQEKNPLRVMYASLHDIWSYPCEDGDPSLVAAASLVLTGGHGQYISNVHLEPWESETDFHERLYPEYRRGLLDKAREFVRLTGPGEGEEAVKESQRKTMVIVSLGCDASEHESGGMSRHNRNVPTSFYRRFALDAVSFARQHAAGKCLAVLEGGYSDRALASASAAFLSGFTSPEPEPEPVSNGESSSHEEATFGAESGRDGWWTESNLKRLEKACSVAKSRRGAYPAAAATAGLLVGADTAATAAASADRWLVRAVEVFAQLEDTAVASSITSSRPPGLHPATAPNSPRQLRDRRSRPPINYASLADGSSPLPSPARGAASTSALRRPQSSNRLRSDAVESSSSAAPTPASPLPPPPVPLLSDFSAYKGREVHPTLPAASFSDWTETPAFAFTAPCSDPAADSPSPSAVGTRLLVPAANEGGAAPTTIAENVVPSKPAIRFTWKQGGFGGEPRM
ncbi:hypothetical protein JCM3774_000337 [Rhodotorula dairenensis]